MTITYRTEGSWGLGKGGNLTPAEVDLNFFELVNRIDSVGDGLVPAEIASITLVGNQLTFVLTDAREFGPFNVPSPAFRFIGSWEPATAYLGNDVIETVQGIFLVLQSHTSASSFDPARVIGGQPVYQLLFREPRSQVYLISDTTVNPALDQVWGYFRCTVTCTVVIPHSSTVPYPVGAELHFRQVGSGPITFFSGTGVIVTPPADKDAATNREGAVVTIKKVGTDTWDMFGVLRDTV